LIGCGASPGSAEAICCSFLLRPHSSNDLFPKLLALRGSGGCSLEAGGMIAGSARGPRPLILLLFTAHRKSQRENIKKERKQERHHLSLSLSLPPGLYIPQTVSAVGVLVVYLLGWVLRALLLFPLLPIANSSARAR